MEAVVFHNSYLSVAGRWAVSYAFSSGRDVGTNFLDGLARTQLNAALHGGERVGWQFYRT